MSVLDPPSDVNLPVKNSAGKLLSFLPVKNGKKW